MLRNGTPVRFIPSGLSDSVDQESSFPGACQSMVNGIFDRQNRGAIVSRPGVTSQTTFSGFTSPGAVSVAISVGTRIYGMIGTGRNVGYDEPFCYDTSTSAFVTVSGVLSTNVPSTQSTSGAWTPPTMDVIGTKVVVTHPGFSGANFFGWFDISNPAAPAWSAGNTATNALPSKPIWVAQFYGRAYYGCSNAVYFSDSLVATNISNANFAGVLTLGDTSATTGASGLAFSTSSAGILQSLVVFKASTIYQISGDIALTGSQALSLNLMSANVGCVMPRTAVSTPYGVIFIATDGPRLVDLRGQIQYLSNHEGTPPDIVAPFSNATTPSRACAAYNNGIYRVSLDTTIRGNTYQAADLWYDFLFSKWNGPHSFPYHGAVQVGASFYLISNSFPGALFKSDVVPSVSSVYTDNGTAYNTSFLTTNMPTVKAMTESAIIESTIELGKNTASSAYSVIASDDLGNILNQVTINFATPNSKWGAVNWGAFIWQSSTVANHVLNIPWTVPIVFKKMTFLITSTASYGFSVREIDFRYQPLGYTNA